MFDLELIGFDVKRVLVVIIDKKFMSCFGDVKKVVLFLEEGGVKIVFVVVGLLVEFSELEVIILNRGYIIEI